MSTKHSRLGASGAERWMNCPGSIALLNQLQIAEDSDEPDYTREGTALHEASAHCLKANADAWEIVGETFYGTVIDDDMASAVQLYLNEVRPTMARSYAHYIEYAISSPVHADYFGTLDFGAVIGDDRAVEVAEINITDLKGGKGIIVDPEENPQLKYYAYGLVDGLERQDGVAFPDETKITLRIVQPRAYHSLGPVRTWETTVGALREWVHSELVPAMVRAETADELDAGEHCRFCPAKLVCPLLTSLFRAAASANPKHVVSIDDATIGLSYKRTAGVKMYLKALEEETFKRLQAGKKIDGVILVNKRANRIFKDGALDLAKARFGGDVMNAPEVKSPAELEKLSPAAAEFVKEFAYLPKTGLTVAIDDGSKVAVKVLPLEEKFHV